MEVELHPYNPQHSLKSYCEARGILLEAYSPLGSTSEHLQTGARSPKDSPLLHDPVVSTIAEKHGASVGTVLISWQVNRGVIVLPKSVSPNSE